MESCDNTWQLRSWPGPDFHFFDVPILILNSPIQLKWKLKLHAVLVDNSLVGIKPTFYANLVILMFV